MTFSMTDKEQALAKEFGAIAVMSGMAWKHLVLHEGRCALVTRMAFENSSTDYPYRDIRSVEFSTAGVIQPGHFYLNVGGDTPKVISVTTKQGILYKKSRNVLAEQIRVFIEERRSEPQQQQQPQLAHSSADELKKFADLRDQGIITEEDFQKKKDQLLGI